MEYAEYEWDDELTSDENEQKMLDQYDHEEKVCGDRIKELYENYGAEELLEKARFDEAQKELFKLMLCSDQLKKDAVAGRNLKLNNLCVRMLRGLDQIDKEAYAANLPLLTAIKVETD